MRLWGRNECDKWKIVFSSAGPDPAALCLNQEHNLDWFPRMRAMSLVSSDADGEQNEIRSLQEKLESTMKLVSNLSGQLTELKEQVGRGAHFERSDSLAWEVILSMWKRGRWFCLLLVCLFACLWLPNAKRNESLCTVQLARLSAGFYFLQHWATAYLYFSLKFLIDLSLKIGVLHLSSIYWLVSYFTECFYFLFLQIKFTDWVRVSATTLCNG